MLLFFCYLKIIEIFVGADDSVRPVTKEMLLNCWEFTVKKEHDGYKDILVNNLLEPKEKDIEERLLVIIPHFTEFKTSCKKIAGRYPEEGIIEMKVGDTVTVNKIGAKPETYMAVQAGNEMFLVKKNR